MDDAVTEYRHSPAVTIRWATTADACALGVLAELDEARVPEAPILLAFVDDELCAAMSLSTRALISDPFRRTSEVAALLLARGRQLTVHEPSRFAWFARRRRPSALRRFTVRAQPRS